jgi:hypothetical protein
MDKTTLQRGQMAFVGALAGLIFYGLSKVVDSDVVSDRGLLAIITFAAIFFTGLLALSGPLTIARAALWALGLAGIATLLFLWASFRFDTLENYFFGPFPVLATVIIGTVPLPFAIAASGPGWRDYPALFSAAWSIVVRYAAAWVFVGVVWGLIYLSDTLLSIVGVTVIEDLIDIDVVPFLVTGLTLGLALAVVQEMKDYVSPYLILRLLRLLLPVVLVVMVVFVVALPVQGLSGLFGGLSVSATLLVMTAAAATLITTAIDQTDGEATQSPLLARATQALAVILPIPAGLAAYSIWLRVDQYGWTPDRLFAALMACLAVAYGLFYAGAVIRRGGWMARIRQANVFMALTGVAAAMLWLTPILNAERISSNSLIARYQAGKTTAAELDIGQLDDWGQAGAAVRETLTARAKGPGQEALAAVLSTATALDPYAVDADPAKVRSELITSLPLQPATATADRDRLMADMQAYDLASWLTACRTTMPDGKPGCVMVIADFNQIYEGNEAVLVLRDAGDSMRYEALVQINGVVERRSVSSLEGYLPYDANGASLIAQMQAAAPKMTPAPLNQMIVGARSLLILP